MRLRSGRLHELFRGVYLVGHCVPTERTRQRAALLALRDRGTLSHRTATSLWGLLPYPTSAPVWVTIPPTLTATRPGIEIRRADLDRRDIRRRHRMSLTSPPRTVLDMAALLDPRRRRGAGDIALLSDLENLVATAQFRCLATEAELIDQIARNPGRRGVATLREVLGIPGGPQRTRSDGERALLRALRRHRIDGFEANGKIHGYEVDFLWRELDFAVEVDGYEGHSGRIAFERDREKIAALTAKGLTVMPVTGRQLRISEGEVIVRLKRSLEARSRQRVGS